MEFKYFLLFSYVIFFSFNTIRASEIKTEVNNEEIYWLKIKANNKYERTQISNLGVSIETTRDGFVAGTARKEIRDKLESLQILETSFPLTEAMDFPTDDSAFHNYTEITSQLRSLAEKYPHLMELTSIGQSTEGRKIWVARISSKLNDGKNLPGVIFMGGHHAREHLSIELPLYYVEYLLSEYTIGNKKIKSLLDSREIHIIPVVNPDGAEFDISKGSYQMWRKNRTKNKNGSYGVDLNRNYDSLWGQGGSSTNPNDDTYMGLKPFSEPETQAVKNYIESHTNITTLLSFHTYSELILYPWGGKYTAVENAQDRKVFETMAKQMAQWNHYTPQQSSELYIATGDTCDWAYGQHKIFSFTFELDPADAWSSGGFYPGAKIIPDVIQKNTNPFIYLIEYSDNPYRVLSEQNLYRSF